MKLTKNAVLNRIRRKLVVQDLVLVKSSRYAYVVVDRSEGPLPMALHFKGAPLTVTSGEKEFPVVRMLHDLEHYGRELGVLADDEEAPQARCLGPCSGRCIREPMFSLGEN